jgi:hypothetical protein
VSGGGTGTKEGEERSASGKWNRPDRETVRKLRVGEAEAQAETEPKSWQGEARKSQSS